MSYPRNLGLALTDPSNFGLEGDVILKEFGCGMTKP